MSYGYWGKILKIDLNNEKYEVINLEDEIYEKYLGASGIGGYLLHEEYDYDVDPLAPENPLIFMTGLLTGTSVPTAAKSSVVTKAPLTGIWTESTVGGYWGNEIKKTGYDGFIIEGKAEKSTILTIKDDQVEFFDAEEYMGKDVYETEEKITEEKGEMEVACIGPAGENEVKIAGIMIGGRETRAAGRTGVGALMGSKNLKAIGVKGSNRVPIYDKDKLSTLTKEFMPDIQEGTKGLHDYGTAGGVQAVESNGDLPIKNWTLGSWEEGAAKTDGQKIAETVQTGHYACYACPIRCGKNVEVRVGPYKGSTGHGPEYETAAGFGSNVLNDDIDYLCAANDLCNRLGLDTISTGNAIAMAMECYENGLINKEDTGGIELNFGNGEALIEFIPKIANKEDIGAVFAKGVKEAAEEIGGMAKEFAIHTKGLSNAFHDPRAFTSMAANYATANRGACHLEALSYFAEPGAFPLDLLDFEKDYEYHGQENKAEIAVIMQDFMNVSNALGLCKFLIRGNIGPQKIKDWVNAVTGWDLDKENINLMGERLFNLKRMYNVKQGISRKDDKLPPRLLSHAKESGTAEGSLAHIGKMLNEYYNYRGWSQEGIPKEEKLEELDLKL
ncbi:MAG: aldehyde ferredoxin oxidoreductase family protein [Halanaerobiales bacterium]